MKTLLKIILFSILCCLPCATPADEIATIIIDCPAMPVMATGLGKPRLTDELVATGKITYADKTFDNISITFPPCYVRRTGLGRFMVDALVASGTIGTTGSILLNLPPEPVSRRGFVLLAHEILSQGNISTDKHGKGPASVIFPDVPSRRIGIGAFLVAPVRAYGKAYLK